MRWLAVSRMDATVLSFEVEPSASNPLAWMNAMLGLQRTLMAAERTGVTLIVFGFTLAQLFQHIGTIVPPQFLVFGPHLPRNVGLLMIAAGVGSLALFTWQYLRAVKYLSGGPFAVISLRPRMPLHQLSSLVACAIMAIGVLAFGSVFVSF